MQTIEASVCSLSFYFILICFILLLPSSLIHCLPYYPYYIIDSLPCFLSDEGVYRKAKYPVMLEIIDPFKTKVNCNLARLSTL